MEESTKEIVRKAATAVSSLKETEFDIRFNPDVFSPQVRHVDANGEGFIKEKQLVKDAADYLVVAQVPSFVSIFNFFLNIFKKDIPYISETKKKKM